MDRKLLSFAIFLLVIEVTWLLGDLHIIDVPFFNFSQQEIEGQAIGRLIEKRENVRRRSANSLVWQTPERQETVYAYDSLLTLSQSSATVKLENASEIYLSENTLVVLEPNSSASTDSPIRITLNRGHLRSRMTDKATEIKVNDSVVRVQRDSEFAINVTEEQDIQVRVQQGKAQIERQGKTVDIQSGDTLDLKSDEDAAKWSSSSQITWQERPPQRIYSHRFPYELHLAWQGEAEQLVYTAAGESSRFVRLDPQVNKYRLFLDPGTYLIHLQKDQEISRVQFVEVWQAPVSHLLYPLPRNRLATGETTTFSWQSNPKATTYRVQFSKNPLFAQIHREYEVHENLLPLSTNETGLLYWRVVGMDSDGYPIPSLYSNPVFYAPRLLAPPKLKKVLPQNRKLRAPASDSSPLDKNSSPAPSNETGRIKDKSRKEQKTAQGVLDILLRQLFPKALAQQSSNKKPSKLYDVEFLWEAVPGADHYVIEIDTNADFQNPLLIEKTKSTDFVWKGVPLRTVYWRVAGGAKNQMGLFSSPRQARLEHLKRQSTQKHQQVRVVEAKIPVKPEMPKKQTPVVPPKKEKQKKDQTVKKVIKIPWRPEQIWVGSQTGYRVQQAQLDDIEAVSYKGVELPRLLLGRQWASGPRDWLVEGEVTISQWKVAKPRHAPFQDDLSGWLLDTSWLTRSYNSSWFWGGRLSHRPAIERAGLESIQLSDDWLAGPEFRYLPADSTWQHQLMIQYGSKSSHVGWQLLWQGLQWRNWEFLLSSQIHSRFYHTGGTHHEGLLGFRVQWRWRSNQPNVNATKKN